MSSLNQVRYFLEVARAASIREASERLNIAPSALSRQIQTLEASLGMPLFERRPRGMVLTPAGEVYSRYAQAIALESDRVRTELEELRGLRRGRVRVYTVEGIVADMLTRLIGEFHEKLPGISFRLVTTGTDDVVAAVREGLADIGISFNAQPDTAVRFVRRFSDPLVALVHPAHPLADRGAVRFREILPFRLGVPEPGFGIRRLIDDECRRLGVSILPALETNSIEALRGFARSGAGVTLMSSQSSTRELAQGLVCKVGLQEPALLRSTLDVGVLAGRRLPNAASEFLAALDRIFSGHGG
ncbi:LysR family transcriptional regulator [Aquabacter spiritensis]|uniref:DNA-binding transcriptional LysR family regulator n=1 Tax=Aquabacter spiritensis TaxID=933073 RepID=A0A4R3LUA8_9HYPH|nr:LysR family transcriptional regulator [Aquabacter spiritensis]TCT04190.1 DNA-binding transcriptional LysR family regulator [Aquabacter spiritensis]